MWHAAASLAEAPSKPERVIVVSEGDLPADLFQDLPVHVDAFTVPDAESRQRSVLQPLGDGEERCLAVHAAAVLAAETLEVLLDSSPGSWVVGGPEDAAAAHGDPERLSQLLRLPDPFAVPNGVLAAADRLSDSRDTSIVQNRAQLAATSDRIRRQIVRGHMAAGVTFLLPETVLVDVDVRIGRDSILYPGVVLEGSTTVGDETVIGPGCRIIDSWVGSGVELRGWNYISHTSIRNRAILEPYVRRGFD